MLTGHSVTDLEVGPAIWAVNPQTDLVIWPANEKWAGQSDLVLGI